MPLEIACFNLTSAVRALNAGADRIELCGHDFEGGSTPAWSDLSDLINYRNSHAPSVPIHVMIRPTGDNFVYTDAEFDRMKAGIGLYHDVGADGFVFGILTSTGRVDKARCSELVRLARKPCTFHRAFDEAIGKQIALEDIIECGFSAVLTSGGEDDVFSGRQMLADLVSWSGSRIEIMPGGGLRGSNLEAVRKTVHATWWHSSADVDGSGMASAEEIDNLKDALEKPYTNGLHT